MGFVQRYVVAKGLAGGSRFFTALSVIVLAFKVAKRLSGNAPKILHTYELKPGEAVVVTDVSSSKDTASKRKK